jgi:hypothetical protein
MVDINKKNVNLDEKVYRVGTNLESMTTRLRKYTCTYEYCVRIK